MFIDLHAHTQRVPGPPTNGKPSFTSPEDLIERYDEIGVDKAVLLPLVSPEYFVSTQSNEDILDVCSQFSDRFIPFCNLDPRAATNSAQAPLNEVLLYYKERGCKGVGEVTANMRFDHPMVENLFKHCEALELPILFHISPQIGGCYGLYDDPGLPLLDNALAKFPGLILIGHSQPFWAEIAALENPEARNGYPTGAVTEEGAVPRLMRRYPNLYCDLSAGSGHNALNRDPNYAARFMEEFQDRLCFGLDICAPGTPTPLVDFLKMMLEEELISQPVLEKIAHTNTERLLRLYEQ